MEEISSNKRIAKNTLLMYVRMLIMMFIGFYTSRVVLNALGISDLGLMNVAGSVLGMFSFINETFVSGTQRFLSFAIGEGNPEKLKKTFRCAFTIHVLIAILVFILGETIGLWYVYNKLVIEPGRFNAALWCYQLSLISVLIGIIQIPFQSALVAHEKIGVYAYMSIFDAAGRLLIAYLIQLTPWDKVITYSTLMFVVCFTPTFIYNYYCRKHFYECAFRCGYDKEIFHKMIGFSGWNTFGSLVGMSQGSGMELILNSFCGTIVNGARGIALQANGWIMKFVNNFMVALNPQIIKSYASGDIERMCNLIVNGSRLGCYLLLFLGIPLFIKIEWVLNMWLGQCPQHTVAFMRIAMIEAFFRTMGNATVVAMHATGRMKILNIVIAPILLMVLPMSYILFTLGFSPEIVLMFNICPWAIVPLVRIFLVKKYVGDRFSIKKYIFRVYLNNILLAILMFLVPFYVSKVIGLENDFRGFIMLGIVSVISSSFILLFIGMNNKERMMVKGFLLKKFKK